MSYETVKLGLTHWEYEHWVKSPASQLAVQRIVYLETVLKDIAALGDTWSAQKAARTLDWSEDNLSTVRCAARS